MQKSNSIFRMLATIFFCVALSNSFAAFSAEPFTSLRKQCDQLMREKNYEYAIKVLTKMSELRPKNSVVVRDIGECHYRLHHNDDALKYLTRSIEISKYDWWALNLRYHVYLELGEYKKALLDCQKCIQLKPSFVAAQRDLITLCSKLPRDKDAKLILSKLNEFEPVTAARALMGNSNFRGAIDILTAGLKTANTPALKVRILEQRKKCFFNLGDHANSLADLNEIIRLEPSAKAYVFLQRANEERALKNYSASAKDLTTVINMHPTAKQIHLTLDELYYRRAFCYIEMKEFQKAIADLDTLLKIDPAQEEAHKLRG